MDRRNMYKAVITEPNHKPGQPDEYGTLTIPPTGVRFGHGPEELVTWAMEALPKLTDNAYCVIYRIDEVETQQITKAEAVKAKELKAAAPVVQVQGST